MSVEPIEIELDGFGLVHPVTKAVDVLDCLEVLLGNRKASIVRLRVMI